MTERKQSSTHLKGLNISINGREATMIGACELPEGKLEVLADGVDIRTKTGPLKGKVVSHPPLTTVYDEKGGSVTGYLVSQDGRRVTLDRGDGARLTTGYARIETAPFNKFTIESSEKQEGLTLALKYKDKLSTEVTTHVVSQVGETLVLQQQLSITNDLPFDIVDAKSFFTSFQRGASASRGGGAPRGAAAAAAAMPVSFSEMATEQGQPVDIGPIALLESRSVLTSALTDTVPLKTTKRYADMAPDDSSASLTLLLKNEGKITLYPSAVALVDEKTGLPTTKFHVPLAIVGGEFEAGFGTLAGLEIKETVVNKSDYAISVRSNLKYDIELRVSDHYYLKGRKDIHLVKAGKEAKFTGRFEAR
ncbi:Hypothetical protein POVN_LOCUS380 [uncultured virus]|nr:Hypothetical protein POVN_LOCUS380 [uncultured virus]